jgi:oligoendopeptidase F
MNEKKNFIQEVTPEWDLSDLYESLEDKRIQSDFLEIEKLKEVFVKKYLGLVLTLNSDSLFEAIQMFEVIGERSAKLATFAYLHKAKDLSDTSIAIFYQNTMDKLSKIESEILFFSLELNKFEESMINQFIEQNPELKKYQSWLKKVFKFKKYNLSDEAEKVLYLKSTTSSSMLIRMYDEIHADLQYPFEDEGKIKLLNNSEIFHYLTSSKAEIRKKAAFSISKVLQDNSKSLTMIMNMIAKDKLIEDELRGFKDVLSSRNLVNDIEDNIVKNLIDTVKSFYPKIPHRYYKLKAKWLGVEKMNYWDRNAPLPSTSNRVFSWNESRDIVLKSFNNFSPRLHDEAKKFFDNGWIDGKITKGKTSGAFCHPSIPSLHPYMLMNFQGKIYDIMTLSHELGHCVHYMLSKKNGYLSNDIPLTFAETASVFGEQLTFRYLLNLVDSDKEEKKSLIAKKVEDMLNTVFRQIAFCDFEYRIHTKRKESELSNEDVCSIWMDVQKEILGDAFDLEEGYRSYWSYISHFIHAPFYVYSYAFGDCLVNSLYKFYLSNEYNFAEKYLKLLELGGTMHHKELLKPFGMNLEEKDFFTKGLSIIVELIDELEKLS